jgi:hypothetical protein
MSPQLKPKVEALQNNLEALIKLLGSNDPEKRLQFWEILRGITTPAAYQLVEHELTVMNNLVQQVTAGAKTLQQTSKEFKAGAQGAAAH